MVVLGLGLALVLGIWASGRESSGFPSARSRGPSGLLAARLYLEAQLEERSDGEVALLDRPLDETFEAQVLVTVFPWRRVALGEDLSALTRWLRRGGTLIVGYSGRSVAVEEQGLFDALSLELDRGREQPPLAPLAWRSYQREQWTLVPQGELVGGFPPLVVRAMAGLPRPPEGAEVWFARQDAPATGSATVFRFARGQGQVIVLPAQLLGHSRLREPGPSALWAALVGTASEGGGRWVFDEFHQGLVAADVAAAEISLLPFDLFLAHLVLAYLLAVWALARRFGPAWRETPPRLGTSGSFLVGLGRLHDRLRHHAEAAKLLVERAAELDRTSTRRTPGWIELASRAGSADRADLVALAREVAARRKAVKPL